MVVVVVIFVGFVEVGNPQSQGALFVDLLSLLLCGHLNRVYYQRLSPAIPAKCRACLKRWKKQTQNTNVNLNLSWRLNIADKTIHPDWFTCPIPWWCPLALFCLCLKYKAGEQWIGRRKLALADLKGFNQSLWAYDLPWFIRITHDVELKWTYCSWPQSDWGPGCHRCRLLIRCEGQPLRQPDPRLRKVLSLIASTEICAMLYESSFWFGKVWNISLTSNDSNPTQQYKIIEQQTNNLSGKRLRKRIKPQTKYLRHKNASSSRSFKAFRRFWSLGKGLLAPMVSHNSSEELRSKSWEVNGKELDYNHYSI